MTLLAETFKSHMDASANVGLVATAKAISAIHNLKT